MKKGILLAAVIFLSAAGFARTQEGELSGTIDINYLSKYIWRGIDVYDDKSAFQPSLDLDLYGTGFGLNVFWSRANTSGFEDIEELDLTLRYSDSLFEYETYATDWTFGWVYYAYPDAPPHTPPGVPTGNINAQEFFATLSWPEICPEGVIPSYTVIHMWASESGSPAKDLSGWMHIFELGYDVPVEGFLPEIPEQILHLSAAVFYNEGMLQEGVDHDWSHAVFGVSTDFDLGNDLTFIPGVYYQSSWEKTVNPSDELWCSMGLRYSF